VKVAFVVPALRLSGGVNVILQYVRRLPAYGIQAVILLTEPVTQAPWDFELPEALDVRSIEDAADECFDVAIATWWYTVFDLARVRAQRRAFFVQSLEDRMYPALRLRRVTPSA